MLIAGKGHEDYQEVAGVKHPFSDKVHAQRALDARRRGMSSMFTLLQAMQLDSRRHAGGRRRGTEVLRVHSDTRTLQPGDLFVALKGERFDANDFLADAQAKGAVAAIAHRGRLPADCRASRWTTASSRSARSARAGARSSTCR